MSKGLSTATNPWSSGSNDILSLLKERGYNVTETQSGKYSVDLGNGRKVVFEKWEPLWTVLNRIENAPKEQKEVKTKVKTNKKQSNNVLADMAEKDHERYNEIVDTIKEKKDICSVAKTMWRTFSNKFTKLLKQNDTKDVNQLSENDKKLAQEYKLTADNSYAQLRRNRNDIIGLGFEGASVALEAGKKDMMLLMG